MRKTIRLLVSISFILSPVIYFNGLDPTFLKTALIQSIGFWILALWFLEQPSFKFEPIYPYFLWCILSWFWSIGRWGQPAKEVILTFAYLGFFICGRYYMKEKLLKVMVITAAIITLYWNFYLTGIHFTRDKVGPTFCQPNIYASWLVLLLPVIMALSFRKKLLTRSALLTVFAFGCIALHMSGCRGGMIALLSAILFLIILYVPTGYKKLTAFLSLTLSGVVLAPFYVILTTPGAQWERLSYWRSCIDAIHVKGLTGWGLGSFRIVYQRFQEPFMQAKFHNLYLENAHNFYLQTWVETGLIGLLLFIGTVWFILRQADLKDPIKLGLVAAIFGCLVDANFNVGLQFAVIGSIFWLWLGILSREGELCAK